MADISKIVTLDGTTYGIKDSVARKTMTGATSQMPGMSGLVPAPTTADVSKFLCGDGTWTNVPTADAITNAQIDALFS